MKTSPETTRWLGYGIVAIAASAAAYNLGRVSAENKNQCKSRHDTARDHDAARDDDSDVRSALSIARKKLVSCEQTLQRRDHHIQKSEEKPHVGEGSPTPPPEPALSKQCDIASRASELNRMSENCRDFRWQFNAYEEVLGSASIDCEAVLSIRDLARDQFSICSAVLRHFEDASKPDVTGDIRGISAMENAYMTKDEYGDIDIDELVKSPECIARMQVE
ncbi:hypothetical protein WMF18_32275 [Sorangium sp. So ce315]|uniref:hypothetical protein n=1 Tax=Sorangium sp. So ce315 TaxID=3133299 RepID=UPI003F5DD67B